MITKSIFPVPTGQNRCKAPLHYLPKVLAESTLFVDIVVRDHGDSSDTANVVKISEADSIVDDSSVVVKTGQACKVGVVVVVVEPCTGK